MDKPTNKQIKEVRELLADKKARDEKGVFVAEGKKIFFDILEKNIVINYVLVSTDFYPQNKNIFDKTEIDVYVLNPKDFDRISNLQNSQGVLAVVNKPQCDKNFLSKNEKLQAVVCDGVQDPGNMGNIIRTAAAFNYDAVILTGDSVDAFNPKVVRAASGTLLDIPIFNLSISDLEDLKSKGLAVYTSHLYSDKSKDLRELRSVPGRMAVVFGSEGRGVSGEIEEITDLYFYIPVSDKVESLNVSSAASISLYYFSQMRT